MLLIATSGLRFRATSRTSRSKRARSTNPFFWRRRSRRQIVRRQQRQERVLATNRRFPGEITSRLGIDQFCVGIFSLTRGSRAACGSGCPLPRRCSEHRLRDAENPLGRGLNRGPSPLHLSRRSLSEQVIRVSARCSERDFS